MLHEESERLYTTGEIAERCNVSVRTVQYYDEKGLVHPATRSEGGRRLYDDASLGRMKTICLLKTLGLSLKAIKGILENPDDSASLLCLLEEQERSLSRQIDDNRVVLDNVRSALAGIRETGRLKEDIDVGVGPVMNNKVSKLKSTKRRLIIEGIIVDLVEVGMLAYGIMTGQWLPFICTMVLIAIICVELVGAYYRNSRYICPQCHATFQPELKSFFLSAHTPKTRKLTCMHCGEKSWCAEVSIDRVEVGE